DIQYSTDDGVTWTTVSTIDDSNHTTSNTCAPFSIVIPAASLPNGSDVKLQIANTWATGDYYFYVDNFNATQVVANAPNCDAL
ncbi:T9SS C-terminal target domain-containing protein, partial [Aquimarina celericrescens]|nr:T9SS C-terminal target domain-containing protein [Aquimarina celericrescens]